MDIRNLLVHLSLVVHPVMNRWRLLAVDIDIFQPLGSRLAAAVGARVHWVPQLCPRTLPTPEPPLNPPTSMGLGTNETWNHQLSGSGYKVILGKSTHKSPNYTMHAWHIVIETMKTWVVYNSAFKALVWFQTGSTIWCLWNQKCGCLCKPGTLEKVDQLRTTFSKWTWP